jgi:hypothetical protein
MKPIIIYDRIADPKLDRLQDSIIRGLNYVNSSFKYPYGVVTNKKTETYNALFEDAVVCNTTSDNVYVYLPNITSNDLGKFVHVINLTGPNSVVVKTRNALVGTSHTALIMTFPTTKIYFAADIGQWISVT